MKRISLHLKDQPDENKVGIKENSATWRRGPGPSSKGPKGWFFEESCPTDYSH